MVGIVWTGDRGQVEAINNYLTTLGWDCYMNVYGNLVLLDTAKARHYIDPGDSIVVDNGVVEIIPK